MAGFGVTTEAPVYAGLRLRQVDSQENCYDLIVGNKSFRA
jgi:TRAP-type C4-dicarboxylate transport system substrate-binding protein